MRQYANVLVIGVTGIMVFMALCIIFLNIPAYRGANLRPSDAACAAAARYVFQAEHIRPPISFAEFEHDNPEYCENALVVPGSDGVFPGYFFEQVINNAEWVRVRFGPKLRKVSGRPGRVVIVRNSGVDDAT